MKKEFWVVVAGSLLAMACREIVAPEVSSFLVNIIPSKYLPERFDGVTYFYSYSRANTESLLTVISQRGVRWNQARQPLDNRCLDPIGPRFTVELQTEDRRIESFNFVRGTGRLTCASMLNHYLP
jgi:hypothetical protein